MDEPWRVEVRLARRREAKAVEAGVRAALGPTVGRDGRTVYADAGSWPQAEHFRTVVERTVADRGLEAAVAVRRHPSR